MSENKYLEKIASTRLIRELGKGIIPLTKDLKNSLVRSGAMRSGQTYIKGMDTGTENIAKKHGIPLHRIDDSHPMAGAVINMGGAATKAVGGKHPTVFIHEKGLNKAFNPFEQKVIHRHELNEAIGMKHDLVRHGTAEKLVMVQPSLHNNGAPYGQHNNLGVLARESNDIRKLPHLHPLSNNNKLLRQVRKDSGEQDTLAGIVGKRYGEQGFTHKDIEKLNKSKGNLTTKDTDELKQSIPKEFHPSFEEGLKKLKAAHIADRYPKRD
jgi:hypothetical protein